ncbi:MAG: hypothetical protein K0Q95_38 [Bacteroidota bacterium]|jgi:DNA-binding beta-propeller fold protein YncE|nr:hypothetical protein [Bacteroidota bacterium]
MKISLKKVSYILFSFFCCSLFITCSNEKGIPDYNSYPDDVGKLIFTKCATSGCHNEQSKAAAAGLSLQSWDDLFKGGNSGPAVIPYRSDYSTLFYFTNTFSDLGVTLKPTMPYNKPALSREEVLMLKNWIDAGAPNRDGVVKFSDDPSRKKYYVTNQGCDVVTVFDQQSGLPMRYITVGQSGSTESPHAVKVSPDKKYWFVLSLNGSYLEKYNAVDDSYAGRAYIGAGYWNAFTISPNSQKAYCTDLSSSGKVATVDLNTLTCDTIRGFSFPHGIAVNASGDTLLVTQQIGSSKLYKIPAFDFFGTSEINLFSTPPSLPLNPHEVVYSPDGSKYYVSCQGTNEVRVFSSGTDAFITSIAVGTSPTEMAFSNSSPYLFVSCTEDETNFPGKRGSVAVINYQTNTLIKYIYAGWQPHGIAVDDAKKLVVVGNRNYAMDGPSPHHAGECGGRNGYITFINITTLSMVTLPGSSSAKKIEVSVDPYSIGIR